MHVELNKAFILHMNKSNLTNALLCEVKYFLDENTLSLTT